MAKTPVFYSFHFESDVFRVQQVRNMGTVEGNASVSPQEWEQLKRTGNAAVERWIDENMKYKRCLIVLVGANTAHRPWVQYEILKAWNGGKGVFGIYVHNLRCPRTGTGRRGANPFDQFTVGQRTMSDIVNCFDPSPHDAYGDISRNMEAWVSDAIAQR